MKNLFVKIKNILVTCGLAMSIIASPVLPVQARDFNTKEMQPAYLKHSDTANIFIGDSRTVLMDYYLDLEKYPDTFVIAEVGMGYDWLVSDAIPELELILTNQKRYKNYNIIMNLGVNDLDRIDDYVKIIPKLEQYGTLYYVSVNPAIDRLVESNVTTQAIQDFNKKIDAATDRYIDCYNFLQYTGFIEPDGLHFEEYTSRKMYTYIMLDISIWDFVEQDSKKPATEEQVNRILKHMLP